MRLSKSKSGKEQMGALIVIALILLGIWLYSGGVPTQSGTDSGGTQQQSGNTVEIVGAPCTQGTTLTSSVVRRYTDAAQSSENVTILQNGVLKGTITHGSTTTVQSGVNGDTLDLYVGLESTTFYPRHFQGKISTCTASATTGDSMYFTEVNDATVGGTKVTYSDATGLFAVAPNKLVQIDTAPAISVVNDGQANQNNGATPATSIGGQANLTIGQGGSGSVTVKLSPSANTAWGALGNILECQFPQAVYDSANPIIVTVDGSVAPETNVKSSSQIYPLIAANSTIKAFKFPALDARKTGDKTFSMKFTADANHDPSGVGDRINCTIADVSYYQRQNDGAYVLDIENRDANTDLGGANTVYDFEIGVA